MKYGYYDIGKSIPHINTFTDGSHILVVRNVVDYIDTAIFLENSGWEIRDCIKVLLKDKTLQVGLLRKPFKGTVANNVLTNGCGGININSCRVGKETIKISQGNGFGDKNTLYGVGINPNKNSEHKGRFPANLFLKCTCEEVIEGKSEGIVINTKNSKNINDTIYKLGHSKGEQEAPRAYKDTGATHIDSNCPCKKMDSQSGERPSQGGASRFFFNFTSAEQMKEYLTNLIKV